MGKKYTITVVGMGYVGLSLATLLAEKHRVLAVDILPELVNQINDRISPIQDRYITEYFSHPNLDLTATLDAVEAYREADFVIVAVPTNWEPTMQRFDTSVVESVVQLITQCNPDAWIVIKSTVPVGFTAEIQRKTGNRNILFSPEFLREGRALYDNLYPSRIIVGADMTDATLKAAAERFASLLRQVACKPNVETLLMGSSEAEAVKLFSNAYLALRVAYFNELDSYAESNGFDAKEIIKGVCLDPRIGSHYNNPSFGYGGYCLPKDTCQLLSSYGEVPEKLIHAVVESNQTRKDYIAQKILNLAAQKRSVLREKDDLQKIVVGVYRLTMKADSDNFRNSSIQDVLFQVGKSREGIEILLYEPSLTNSDEYCGFPICHDLSCFKISCDLIVANRFHAQLEDVVDKVYTRDIFGRD